MEAVHLWEERRGSRDHLADAGPVCLRVCSREVGSLAAFIPWHEE